VPCHQELTGRIIGLAIEAHRHRNLGLLELLYATPLCREPRRAGIPARREAGIPAKDVCCASSDDRTPFSVAHRGPCSSSVLKNPWPDTHSSAEWRDSGQSYISTPTCCKMACAVSSCKIACAVASMRLLRALRDHRALRDSSRPPTGRDRTNATGCREPAGRRWEETAASNPLMAIRNVKMRTARRASNRTRSVFDTTTIAISRYRLGSVAASRNSIGIGIRWRNAAGTWAKTAT
jgi:hypothetical protein